MYPAPGRPHSAFSVVAHEAPGLVWVVGRGPWAGCSWPLGDQRPSCPLASAACEAPLPPPHRCLLCTHSCSPWLHCLQSLARTLQFAAVLRSIVEPAQGSCWHRMQSRWLLSYHLKDLGRHLRTGSRKMSIIVLLQTVSSQEERNDSVRSAVNKHPTPGSASLFTPVWRQIVMMSTCITCQTAWFMKKINKQNK